MYFGKEIKMRRKEEEKKVKRLFKDAILYDIVYRVFFFAAAVVILLYFNDVMAVEFIYFNIILPFSKSLPTQSTADILL